MTRVELTGHLLCDTAEQADIVFSHLGEHARLSRAEPGCLHFEVTPLADGRTWGVREVFVDAAAFDAHQARVGRSEWGRVTAGIRREYVRRAG